MCLSLASIDFAKEGCGTPLASVVSDGADIFRSKILVVSDIHHHGPRDAERLIPGIGDVFCKYIGGRLQSPISVRIGELALPGVWSAFLQSFGRLCSVPTPAPLCREESLHMGCCHLVSVFTFHLQESTVAPCTGKVLVFASLPTHQPHGQFAQVSRG